LGWYPKHRAPRCGGGVDEINLILIGGYEVEDGGEEAVRVIVCMVKLIIGC
jgi:hypothetical protein